MGKYDRLKILIVGMLLGPLLGFIYGCIHYGYIVYKWFNGVQYVAPVTHLLLPVIVGDIAIGAVIGLSLGTLLAYAIGDWDL